MKTLLLLLLLTGLVRADNEWRVSIKVILGPAPGNAWPDNTATIGTTGVNLNSEAAIRANIAFTNRMLENLGQGWKIVLREDRIYTLTGKANPWFTADARSVATRDDLEAAAIATPASKADWQWHDDALNIYLNDTRSGICSFPSAHSVILIGAGAYRELIIHEMGHFFNLPHTHSGDNNGIVPTGPWGDGDGFSDTLPDDPDADSTDINVRYPANTQWERDNLIFNIMSYHLPQNRLTWQQRQRLIETSNTSRTFAVNGRAFFIAPDGNNFSPIAGLLWGTRMQQIGFAAALSTNAKDVLVIRNGTYNATAEGLPAVMDKPMVLSAFQGTVIINR